MIGPARSDLRRDLELLDAAALDTVQRILTRELAAVGGVDRTLCLLASERLLATVQTLAGLVARPDEPYRVLEAA